VFGTFLLAEPGSSTAAGDDALVGLRPPRRAVSRNPGGVRPDLRPRRPRLLLGGVTAGIDLALALVEEDHGRELALRTRVSWSSS
jgi:hypothetical protein